MHTSFWVRPIALGALSLLGLDAGAQIASKAADMPVHAQLSTQRVIASTVEYKVPEIQLVRDDGKSVFLPAEMNDGRTVVLNFIFTACLSTCPLSSQAFAQFQRKLGPDSGQVHLMSISSDPEQDTPERLREYARKFGAGRGWTHYGGSWEASLAVQRAFDVYRGDKMSHTPVTLMRGPNSQTWRRIDGFATPEELLREYRGLLGS
jgi:protein SCO1/2